LNDVIFIESGDPLLIAEAQDAEAIIVHGGEPGLPGSAGGGSGDVVQTSLVADVALGGQRVVWGNALGRAVYADHSDSAMPVRSIGVTTGAAAANANVTVQTHGPMEELSWTWTPQQELFLGVNGLMTHTPPASGFSLVVAFAITATKIFIDVKEPVLLIT
jgi:hypothetical protein